MRAERLTFAALALLAALAPAAHAGGEKSVVVDNVSIVVRTPWPDMLSRGAQPLLFELENANPEPRHVRLALVNGFGMRTDRIEKELDISGGARVSFEMFAPVQSLYSSAYHLQAATGGESSTVPGVGCAEQPNPTVRNVLVLSTDLAEASVRGRWQDDLSSEARPRVTTEPTPAPGRGVFGYPGGRVASPGTLPDPVAVTQVLFRDLPTRYESYTSIDGVVIDSGAGLPAPDALAAITSWTRLGGRLAIYGPDATKVASLSGEIAPWLQDRFRVRTDGEVETYMCGQGLLLVGASSKALQEPAQARALNHAMEGSGDWIPKNGTTRGKSVSIKLPGLELPYRSLTLILLLFAVVIGPINFYFVRKTGKPVLLLVTVPAIALIFSIGLFAYGAMAQGLDVRASSATFALLDQRAHRSSSAEVRLFFAGLSAGDGLVPGPGASAWPETLSSEFRERHSYAIDFNNGTLLSGDYLPVRTPVRQTILVDRPCRLRLDVHREGTTFVAENGLGVTVLSLVFRDPEGKLHALQNALAPGAKAALDDSVRSGWDRGESEIVAGDVDGAVERVPRGTYLAKLSGGPFCDRCGVEVRDAGSVHLVLGIVDLAELR
jgi:hypothetical protein